MTHEMLTVEDIEQFVTAQGSDDLGTFGGSFEGGIHLQQIPDEIAPCLWAILQSGEPVRAYLEIGVAAGGMTYLAHHVLGADRLVLIDDNKHHKAGLRAGILAGIERRELIGRSDAEDVVAAAGPLAPFDCLLIDGDHQYPGVKLDVLTYLPMLRPGGFLILHDSAMPEWGVARVVRELQADPAMELVGEYRSATHPRPLGVALFQKVTA